MQLQRRPAVCSPPRRRKTAWCAKFEHSFYKALLRRPLLRHALEHLSPLLRFLCALRCALFSLLYGRVIGTRARRTAQLCVRILRRGRCGVGVYGGTAVLLRDRPAAAVCFG